MNQQAALAQAITLTDEILELLEAGEFEPIGELELQRQPLIQKAFSDSIEQIDLIKAQHLHHLNQQVVNKLTLFKESILLQQARLRTAAKATQSYLSLSPTLKNT